MNKYKTILIPGAFLLIAYLLQTLLPWYSLAFLALIFGYASDKKPLLTFLIYFILGLVLWGVTAYWQDANNQSQLSSRIGVLFGIKNLFVLVFITSLIGGITSGLGAWCGRLFSKYLKE